METARLPIRACIRYGWETFKKRPWFIIGTGALIMVINIIIPAPEDHHTAPVAFAIFVISFMLGSLLQLGATNLAIRLHDNVGTARVADLWRPGLFWAFLGTTILSCILVLLGLIALIIPGIIIGLGLSYATYIVVDRGLGPIESMKESWRITKGNRWRLLLLFGVIVLLNIAGLLALVVGLLVTVPVSVIASVHAYRFLAGAHGGEVVPVKAAAPEEAEPAVAPSPAAPAA